MSEQVNKSAEKMVGVKSAVEWLNEVGQAAIHDAFIQEDKTKPGTKSEHVIRVIQLDAYNAGRIAGMVEAADECYLVNIHGTCKIMNGSCDEIKTRILAAAGKVGT